MKSTRTNPEIRAKAIEILVRELGFEDAMRFMMQYSPGRGDYTRERRKLLSGVTVNEMFHAMNKKVTRRKPVRPRSRGRSA